jgi:hypothetical protein
MVSVVLGFFWPLLARVKHEEINENTPPQSGALQEEDFQRFPGKDKIIQVANHNHKPIYLSFINGAMDQTGFKTLMLDQEDIVHNSKAWGSCKKPRTNDQNESPTSAHTNTDSKYSQRIAVDVSEVGARAVVKLGEIENDRPVSGSDSGYVEYTNCGKGNSDAKRDGKDGKELDEILDTHQDQNLNARLILMTFTVDCTRFRDSTIPPPAPSRFTRNSTR